MSHAIPGLNFCPDDEIGEGIEIPSFKDTMTIPDSHRFGNSRTVYDFEKLGVITEGEFGKIYKCKDKRTNEFVALKKWKVNSLNGGTPKPLLREIKILKTLQHDNVVASYGKVAGKNLDSNYLMLDYCPISLHDLIEKKIVAIYKPEVVKGIMKQLFQGVMYIHEALIVHRDINPDNIVFTESGILKITGFHASRFYTKGNMTPGVTQLEYINLGAPELLFGVKKYGTPVDMWSVGCVFAALLLKKPLFSGSSEFQVLNSIVNILGVPNEAIWPGFTELYSHVRIAKKVVDQGEGYNYFKTYFPDSDNPIEISSQDLLKELLVYFPSARILAKDCVKSSYITGPPDACSLEEIASILKLGLLIPCLEELQLLKLENK